LLIRKAQDIEIFVGQEWQIAEAGSLIIDLPPIPAAFICSSSRCTSFFVMLAPNHHQRINMRHSAGGCANDSRKRWALGSPWAETNA
jgi:hypothetical protein